MKYCSKCILPNTRPNLFNDDQECVACKNHFSKKNINWSDRKKKFENFVKKIKIKHNTYDCVIPYSGGKDSIWQLETALKYNLKPLCLTWKTPARSLEGEENLINSLNYFGCDHLDFTINPKIEKYFTLKSFKKFGSTLIPMHMAIHGLPQQIALNFKIPLILQGENSAFEYGGNNLNSNSLGINMSWLKKHGNTHGTIYSDWFDKYLNKKNMWPYIWNNDSLLKQNKINTIFLGYFFKWDPQKSYKLAKKIDFKTPKIPKTGFYKFADIDDEFLITVHHWMKWYKFGFTRTWDNLSIEIRNKRIKRNQAISYLVKNYEQKPINEIKKFCKYVNISLKEFDKITEKFRNKKIWHKENNKKWKIKDFLIKDFRFYE